MEKLFNKLNIKPKNINLYNTAFSHSSYANEHKAKNDYERLEFLGDAVVDLVLADYLYNNKTDKEGEMTKIRASYVCENALCEYSNSLGLNQYIRVGLGAIYVDLGYATARKVAMNIIVPYIEDPNITFFSDYKSSLQEYVQTYQKSLNYNLIKEEGPAHDKKFTVEVTIDQIVYGHGSGGSKKEAEQEAAKNALKKLAK